MENSTTRTRMRAGRRRGLRAPATAAIAMLLAALAAGCGNKGDLVLPEAPPAAGQR